MPAARVRSYKIAVLLAVLLAWGIVASAEESSGGSDLDQQLTATLIELGFTGSVEATLEKRRGRPLDRGLADKGRQLWHDTILSLHGDTSCSSCHAATAGFGDTQSIAIGIENNNVVGPNRSGPRNLRRAPTVINSAFYPSLTWDIRFRSLTNDPFDNAYGFHFPPPEGMSLSRQLHLLAAQAFMPTTERNAFAGFDAKGDNDDIRAAVMRRINASPGYQQLFNGITPETNVSTPITYDMVATAIAEFEFSLTFANAPIDRFARGDLAAMSDSEKRGALLFFGRANCVACHAVSGSSNEMFSDFKTHVAGVPQLSPKETNAVFDGPKANEDFGFERVTGDPADRYAFRTSPLRNVAVQPAFFHNGAFTRLEDAIRFHLDAAGASAAYAAGAAGLDLDLCNPLGPSQPVLDRLDPLLAVPVVLSDEEFNDLVAFVRTSLLDPRAKPDRLRRLIPAKVPSGRRVHVFE